MRRKRLNTMIVFWRNYKQKNFYLLGSLRLENPLNETLVFSGGINKE